MDNLWNFGLLRLRIVVDRPDKTPGYRTAVTMLYAWLTVTSLGQLVATTASMNS